jgi:ribosomal protein L32
MTLTTWIVIWFFCGIASAAIASNKGLNSGAWFIIGFLFGPLGILAALTKSKTNNKIENEALKEGSAVKCPYCAETIKSEARVCKHCGRDLPKTNSNSATIDITVYKSAIIDGDLAKLKELVAQGGDISQFRHELLKMANVFEHTEISEYLKGLQ